MKITREIIINGQSQQVEYELTGIELDRAYNEVQFQYDKTEVCARLKENGYECVDDIPDNIIAQMAEDFRNEMIAIMEGMGDGRIPAMETVISRHKEDLEEYKEKPKLFHFDVTQTRTHTWSVKANNEEEAKKIFDKWWEDHPSLIDCEWADENGDCEFDEPYEAEGNPEYADIKEDE